MSRSEVISKTNSNMNRAPLASFDLESELSAANKSRKVSECEKIDEFEYKGYYKFGKILGKGSFGTVVECYRKSDDRPVALKFFKFTAIHKWYPESMVTDYMNHEILSSSEFFNRAKNNQDEDNDRLLPSEVACLLRAHTIPGVIKILDYIPADELDTNEDDALIGIVLERDPNEECLFDYLVKRNTVGEREARKITKQLVTISLDLLQHAIFHGDLKSENILINPSNMQIKVIDFGSAQILSGDSGHRSHHGHHQHHHHHHHHSTSSSSTTSTSPNKCNAQSMVGKLVRTFRGTNLYKPPEFILHRCFYPRPSTVWTLGIILYDLVCGRFPFDKDADVLTHQDKEIDFAEHSSQLSDGLKDLIRRCLAFYVADRIVIEKVQNHPWMNTDDL